MTYEITITDFNEDFVKYSYSDGGGGISGRKWFSGVKVGQVWQMTCKGALVVKCIRIR